MRGVALVTGGTGMLGAGIARLLLSQGWRVRLTYLPGDTTLAVQGLQAEHRPADLLDRDALAWALEGVEVVFHTAALVTFDPALYGRQMQINVEGTRRMLQLAAAAKVRRLVHTSTVNTLGVPRAGVGHEETPFDWAPHHLGYMDSKRAAEQLVLEAAHQGQVPAVAVLPGTLFGPGDAHHNAGSYIRLVARSPLILAPPGGTTVAHVDDVAAGHLLALERGAVGQRYILGGEPMTYVEIFTAIAAALGRCGRVHQLPRVLMEAAGRLGSAARGVGLPTPLTVGLARAACANLFYTSDRARKDLGWSFRPGRDAIRDGIQWYRELGWV